MSVVVEEKRCTGCGTVKPTEEFGRRTASHDGLNARCKSCKREADRVYMRSYMQGYRRTNPERVRGWQRGRRERDQLKFRARAQVRNRLSRGQLERPTRCERCGGKGTPPANGRSAIEAHHADYSKPLEIEWLCNDCHAKEHGKLQEAVA